MRVIRQIAEFLAREGCLTASEIRTLQAQGLLDAPGEGDAFAAFAAGVSMAPTEPPSSGPSSHRK